MPTHSSGPSARPRHGYRASDRHQPRTAHRRFGHKQGTTNGVTTDTEGNYQISVSGNATLGFSFIGYKPQSIAVLNRTVIDVTLEEDATMIGEVVAIGYGSQRKEDLSMAVTTVKLDEAAKSRARTWRPSSRAVCRASPYSRPATR